jgi:ZIP family zinc transporter
VIAAFGWGTLAGASYLIGGLLALREQISPRLVGVILGLGAGALIAAIAYELAQEAVHLSDGSGLAAIGLAVGALASYRSVTTLSEELERPSVGLALAAALDVTCEAIVIVGSLLLGHGVGAAVIAGVFLCGMPEAMAWTRKLRTARVGNQGIRMVWLAMMLFCGLVTSAVYALLHGTGDGATALVLAFAGGALLVTLMTELVPTAHAQAGALAGLTATLGFALSFALISLT